MTQPPVLDQLDTRLLETRQVIRSFVRTTSVVDATETGLLLRTGAAITTAQTKFPAGSDEAEFTAGTEPGELVSGSLRVDLVSDSILRVRYAEGEEIPENATPMVVGQLAGPSTSEMRQESYRVVYTTSKLRAEIGLEPFTLRVTTAEGREVCAIGGHEKNHFHTWDSFNTGICRSALDDAPIAVECFTLRPQEAIYGLGEQFISSTRSGRPSISTCSSPWERRHRAATRTSPSS
jgi:hypothetical protein